MRRRLLFSTAMAAVLCARPVLGQDAAPIESEAAFKFLDALDGPARLAVLEREARREGRVVIYGALGIDRASLFTEPFQARYPGIKADFVRLSESGLADKALLESRTGRVGSDVLIASIPWLELIRPALGAYRPTTWNAFDPRLRFAGSGGDWAALAYEILPSAIAWRTDRVAADQAPRSLQQVADPRWKGRAGTTTQLESMLQGLILAYGEADGMALATRLAALDNRTYVSIAALSDALAQGEVDVAWNMGAHRPAQLKAKGAPVDFVLEDPVFGQGITLSTSRGAAHPYAAALFMEFATRADVLEQVDKAEPGRFFGNGDGHYAQDLHQVSKLVLFPALDSVRFRQLKQITDRLYIRQLR